MAKEERNADLETKAGLSLQSDWYSAGSEILAPKQDGNNMQIPENRQKKFEKFPIKVGCIKWKTF